MYIHIYIYIHIIHTYGVRVYAPRPAEGAPAGSRGGRGPGRVAAHRRDAAAAGMVRRRAGPRHAHRAKLGWVEHVGGF